MKKIVVLGSTNTDVVIAGKEIPVPGETISGGKFLMNPGKAGAPKRTAILKLAMFVLFVIGLGLIVGAGQGDSKKEPVKVIFDTDMYTDFDDAGALACLHALADAGECEILATISNTRDCMSVAMCEIINACYGRPDIPVGCVRGIGMGNDRGGSHARCYGATVRKYAKWVRHANSSDAPDAAEVYRKVLSEQPDGSVVICSVGFLSNMRRLVETDCDLVRRKVRLWVAMACKYPKGKEYNSSMDWESSKIALERWPTPIVFSDFDYGRRVFAGRRIVESDDPRLDGPVRDVFKSTLPPRAACSEKTYDRPEGHPSWDETAVLFAVRGYGDVFGAERGTYRMVGTNGDDEWIADANGPHVRLTDKMPKREVGKLIDELMCRTPMRRR